MILRVLLKKTFYFTGQGCSQSWWGKIPQGFSCGLEVDPEPGFLRPGFVTVDCSEVDVKVAKAKNCPGYPDDGDDCYNFINWP